eukprot:scaffold142058_cov35-Prasinocladus_malaysianus.AAC.1
MGSTSFLTFTLIVCAQYCSLTLDELSDGITLLGDLSAAMDSGQLVESLSSPVVQIESIQLIEDVSLVLDVTMPVFLPSEASFQGVVALCRHQEGLRQIFRMCCC